MSLGLPPQIEIGLLFNDSGVFIFELVEVHGLVANYHIHEVLLLLGQNLPSCTVKLHRGQLLDSLLGRKVRLIFSLRNFLHLLSDERVIHDVVEDGIVVFSVNLCLLYKGS